MPIPEWNRKPPAVTADAQFGPWFADLAVRLLNTTDLIIAGVPYRFAELEAYYYKDRGFRQDIGRTEKVLDQTPGMLGVPPPYLDSTDWGMQERETGSRFVRARPELDAAREGLFSGLKPQQLQLKAEQVEQYGANLPALAEALGLSAAE